jgi:hypothetical protein
VKAWLLWLQVAAASQAGKSEFERSKSGGWLGGPVKPTGTRAQEANVLLVAPCYSARVTSIGTPLSLVAALCIQVSSVNRIRVLTCTGQGNQKYCGCTFRDSRLQHAVVQELCLSNLKGPDGSFLATASPTLRSLHMEFLPDFKARSQFQTVVLCTWRP